MNNQQPKKTAFFLPPPISCMPWGVRGVFWTHQYLLRMDPIVFLLGTGGPKTSHVPPFSPVFILFSTFFKEEEEDSMQRKRMRHSYYRRYGSGCCCCCWPFEFIFSSYISESFSCVSHLIHERWRRRARFNSKIFFFFIKFFF